MGKRDTLKILSFKDKTKVRESLILRLIFYTTLTKQKEENHVD
jgi:hypothetical protein